MSRVVVEDKSQVVQSGMIEPPPEVMRDVEKVAHMMISRGWQTHLSTFQIARELRLRGRRHSWKYLKYSFLDVSDPFHAYFLKACKKYKYAYQDRYGTLKPDMNPYNRTDVEVPPCRIRPPPLKGFSVPQGITLKELGLIKITAQFVARYGADHFWTVISEEVIEKPLFSFLKTTDKKYSFYYGLVAAYQRVLKPRTVLHTEENRFADCFYHCLHLDKLDGGDDDDVVVDIDLHAFVGGLDFFTHMDLLDDPQVTIMPPPQPVSALPTMPPLTCRESRVADDEEEAVYGAVRLTRKELGIMKLTAQFVARYGQCFRLALMMRVLTSPTFGFMFCPKYQLDLEDPAAARFQTFGVLVVAYSNILLPCNKFDDSPATLVDAFFLRLRGVEETTTTKEALLDLHAFVAGSVDYFAHMQDYNYSTSMAPPERLSVVMNRPTHSTVLVRLSWAPMHERVASRLPYPTWSVLKHAIPPWITPEELAITKLTAQFTARYGTCFERALMSRLSTEPRFDFMRFDEIKGEALRGFRRVYSAVLKPCKKATEGGSDDDCTATEGDDDECTAMALELFFHCLQLERLKKEGVETTTAVIQLDAFMSGVDYLAYMNKNLDYYATLPPPQRLSVMITSQVPPDGVRLRPLLSRPSIRLRKDLTPKDLVVIKLTALFAARYGMVFCRDLLRKLVVLKAEYNLLFKFMEPSDTWFKLYGVVVAAYSKVVKEHAYAEEIVLEYFFSCLEWEEGGETAMVVDLYAFVEGVDCFAQIEDGNYSALMGNHLVTQISMHGNVLSPPQPKRQKLDE
ncbi:unnamed protein product [Microthlaspi erraticum]|uniref:SURP motif domain-containing protein n=1 Tax=Microthlaspi erraticum TaxID=1685480 RepID=A0A6D2HJH1_9BRAS|nr:unnamed protein product [Microthlaspi erraticum]